MAVKIREMKPTDRSRWDCYVAAHTGGTFCHRAGWKTVVEKGAGQVCPFLLAEKNNEIVGVLPLSLRGSWLFGKALVSTLFTVYGGPLADDTEIYAALDEAAWALAISNGIDVLEYRSIEARHEACARPKRPDNSSWTIQKGQSATFQKSLKSNEVDILLDIPRKQRAVVRKSLKNGLRCVWDKNIDVFYGLYAESVRNLGTPVFPKKLFRELLVQFGDDVEIQVVYASDGKALASLLSFYDETKVLPYYAGGGIDARKYGAHDFMYFNLMLKAASMGKTTFDFGRSKIGSGPYQFKKNWGFEPVSLEYEYRVADGAVVSDLNASSGKFETLVKVWKKLPLPLANFIGPYFSRHLG